MKNKKAFTLFELLVSISIIGILTAIASISYGAAQKKARDSRRIEDLNGIQKAAEQYYGATSYSYPATLNSLSPTYILTVPVDPKGIGYTAYLYTPLAGGYCACAAVENLGTGNATKNDCTAFGAGNFYCVKNQQ
ncbi:MAG: type II secretion system protein [Candidatus Shapirobacteria bacterium]|jgi:prepilin-type N-terminal cleavage/methylation domain-containing protein